MVKLRAVLVGLSPTEEYGSVLAPAYLKAYADAQPQLRARVSIAIQQGNTAEGPAALAERVLEQTPDLVGFSCYIWNFPVILEMCRILKTRSPRIRIIFGGPEAAPQAERLLSRVSEIDFVCTGEGEATFTELLRRLCDGRGAEGVTGLAWRRDGVAILEPERPLIADLDSIPSPYLAGLLPLLPGHSLVMETARGCPFKCKFCDWQTGQKTRTFPVERFLREIEHILEHVSKFHVFMADADVFMDLPRAKLLVDGLGRLTKGRRCTINFQTYLPRLDDEVLHLLNAEQFILSGGVESTNGTALKTMSRFFHGGKIEDAIARMRRIAPRCRLELQLIYGVPGDNLEGFRNSLNWALSKNPDRLFLPQALALPGAEFGRHPENFGITVEAQCPHRILSNETFSAQDIAAAGNLAFRVQALQRESWIAGIMGRLSFCLDQDPLPLWEKLLDYVDRHVPDSGLQDAYARADVLSQAFDWAAWQWRTKTGITTWLRIHRSFANFIRETLRQSGRDENWPAIRQVLRRQRAWILFDKMICRPSFRDWMEQLDRFLGHRALGRGWQKWKDILLLRIKRRQARTAPQFGVADAGSTPA